MTITNKKRDAVNFGPAFYKPTDFLKDSEGNPVSAIVAESDVAIALRLRSDFNQAQWVKRGIF